MNLINMGPQKVDGIWGMVTAPYERRSTQGESFCCFSCIPNSSSVSSKSVSVKDRVEYFRGYRCSFRWRRTNKWLDNVQEMQSQAVLASSDREEREQAWKESVRSYELRLVSMVGGVRWMPGSVLACSIESIAGVYQMPVDERKQHERGNKSGNELAD